MPTYTLCKNIDDAVEKMAARILRQFDSHKPILDAKVRIDFVFAYPDLDENAMPVNDAIKRHGVKALGLCKVIPCDRRAKGEADAEIKLDGKHWESVDVPEQEALLDHELNYISVCEEGKDVTGRTVFKQDSNGRPKLRMRKHDVEVGWFGIIASRHGAHSQERIQAASIMENHGQLYWPAIAAQEKRGRAQHLEVTA
jgi:hypothetical protein